MKSDGKLNRLFRSVWFTSRGNAPTSSFDSDDCYEKGPDGESGVVVARPVHVQIPGVPAAYLPGGPMSATECVPQATFLSAAEGIPGRSTPIDRIRVEQEVTVEHVKAT